jgi:hypothetical protein
MVPSARRLGGVHAVAVFVSLSLAFTAFGQLRKIGELELRLTGLHATADQTAVTVPKNTASGVRVTIRSGNTPLSAAEASRLLGGSFAVQADLAGPGLRGTVSLPDAGTPSSDPFILNIPPLPQAGDYTLSNLRITIAGATVLDVAPQKVDVDVIDQVLITSVTTRPLTLEEIKAKGIVLDNDSYLGFEFTLGVNLDSKTVDFSFPVVFDKRGVAVPQPLNPMGDPERVQMPPLTTIVPMLLQVEEGGQAPTVRLPNGEMSEVRIPSVLVIPGNVGYLKQFFSAKLFVANGAPGSSNLTVHDVTGKIVLPAGADRVHGTADDPLALPALTSGPQSSTQSILMAGLDGKPGTPDDTGTFRPGEQGEAEFLIRGEKEGFHTIDFDIAATLEGLVTGPVNVTGKGSGGVLVRNPYFDMSFTAPAVVRQGEHFTLYVTVNNISQSLANDVRVTLDASRMSGMRLAGEATQTVDTLLARDARTLEFDFIADRTGQVVATYLNLDTQNGSTGTLKFTLGIGERGVALSPDTLVLPSAVDSLPHTVVAAAMRVLGQAWSIANAPSGTLPQGVTRTSRTMVTQKALALAEAGLRISLGEPETDAVRDLLFDFYGGAPVDPGFDQLLRTTNAGTELARAIGAALQQPHDLAGGTTAYERETAQIAASGRDFVTFGLSGAPVTLLLSDGSGKTSATDPATATFTSTAGIPSAVAVPFGNGASAPRLVAIPAPASGAYTLELLATSGGTVSLSVTQPAGTSFRRAWGDLQLVAGGHYRIVADRTAAAVTVQIDNGGDGTFETQQTLTHETLVAQGPRLISANVIGPAVLAGAQPFGYQAAILFDRVVDATSGNTAANYTMAKNKVVSAKRQLSGRLVFATFEQPEGPHVAAQLSVANVKDERNVTGPAATSAISSRLTDIGAVVSGRILNADGTPVAGAVVTYAQNPELTCAPPLDEYQGLSQIKTGDDGRYELRYVRQDNCGMPFQILTRDLTTGMLRTVSSSVRADGEQIVLDIALFGRGSVSGVVRNLSGAPVSGASVVAISQTDTQSGGTAMTDANGVYKIDGLTVGPVNVRAVKGAAAGRNSGRIDRAGSTATVHLTLDGGTVRAQGIVRRVQGSDVQPIPALQVVYYVKSAADGGMIPVAVAETDSTGAYAFEGLPVGEYRIDAALNTRDRGSVSGIAAAGDLVQKDIPIVIGGTGYGTVNGVVKMPGTGAPANDVLVSIDDRGVLTLADGSFELPGVIVKPTTPQTVLARSRDGIRKGTASVTVSQPGQTVTGVQITLSGTGSAEFTVLDANRNPVANQEVALLGDCANACGCSAKNTDSAGRVRFEGLPLGTVCVRAHRGGGTFMDQADATVSLISDGVQAFGVLQFAGAGIVSGTVLGPDGLPSMGADVKLFAKVLDEDSCSLVSGIAQRVRTDPAGKFRFTGVNVGEFSVTASHPFFTTSVGTRGTLTANGATADVTLRLVNTISGVLSGIVYLPDGVTPAGSGVEVTATGPLPDVTVVTDGAGRYEFAKIFPEGNYTLTARDAVTGGVHREQLYLRAAQDITHDLRLKGRGTVRVKVVDGGGHAVTTNVLVRLEETDFPNQQFEAALEPSNNGVAVFENVHEGRFTAQASDAFARGGRSSSTLSGASTTLDVNVALTTTGTIKGRFLRPDRTTPIPFGSVRILANGATIGQTTTDGSGDVGAFQFTYVPAGAIRLEATDPLTARSGVGAATIATEGEVVTVDVVAQGVGRVEGLVTSNGVAQPAAQVEITSGQFRVSTFTDGDGRYAIDGVPEGYITAGASLSGNFLTGTAGGVLSGDGNALTLNVPLRDSGRITGRVLAADGVAAGPLSLITANTGGGTLTTTSSIDGTFSFDRVPAGLVTVSAEVLGGLDKARGSIEVLTAATANINLTLNGIAGITGTALDSTGNAIAGDVTVNGTGSFPYSFTVQAGSDGKFALPQVLAGPFSASLRARSGEFLLYGTTYATVAAGQTAAITVQVQPSGTVTGLVLRSDNATPAIGANVRLTLTNNSGSVTVQAGNDGRFTARGVPLGGFTARIDDPITNGLALTAASLATNGETKDLGTIVLDDQPLRALAFDPVDGTTGVDTNDPITVTFSNQLQGASGISVSNGSTGVGASAALSGDGKTVTLTGTWPDAAEVTVSVSTAVTDVFGRHPASTTTSRFRTIDLSPPKVSAVVPANNAIQIGGNATIAVTFNEPLSAATNPGAVVRVANGSGDIAGSAAITAPAVITFTPSGALADNSSYTVTVNGAIDASGNTQVAAFTSKFSTTDTIAPVLTVTSPSSTAWMNNAKPAIQIAVIEAISGIDATTASVTIDGQPVAAVVSGSTIYYAPAANLANGPHTVAAALSDKAGNSGSVTSTFKIDIEPPTVPVIGGISEGQLIRGELALSATVTDLVSGVDRIELLSDGGVWTTLRGPDYSVRLDSSVISEGPHTFTARAVDMAGNVSATSAPVHAIADNRPLSASISSPVQSTPVRDVVSVTAAASEPLAYMELSAGGVAVTDSAAPYEATFDLTAVAEGPQVITVTAHALSGETAQATRTVIVDRTAPAAPDVTRISAEPPVNGSSLVFAYAGAVEGNTTVEVKNSVTNALVTVRASFDGGFTIYITGDIDQLLEVVAVDAVGNRSQPSTINIRRTASLPPSQGATSLHFNGVLVDRVGPSRELVADGVLDAVFTVSLSIGEGMTRTLSYLDLVGPGIVRTTRAGTGQSVLGVAQDAGSPLLNNANGTVGFPITGGTTLTLFTHNGTFISDGTTYTLTAIFTDGTQFIGTYYLVPKDDRSLVAHSATVTASPATVRVPANAPGTTTITISNIRDLEGTLIPDGAPVAITAANLASKNPNGVAFTSAGGSISGGTVSPNNPKFQVFTVQGGKVTATYSSDQITPTVKRGAQVVVQVQAADADGNVLGGDAISTLDLPLRAASDEATVHASPSTLYADKADRRAQLRVEVRDIAGNPLPDGTKVVLSAADSVGLVSNCCWLSSAGGAILGGSASPNGGAYRAFTVSGGVIEAEYSSANLVASVGEVKTVTISVFPGAANGAITTNNIIGTGTIQLAGPGWSEVSVSPNMVPWVAPVQKPVQVGAYHIQDARSHLVPDGAKLILSAADSASISGCCWVGSHGGSILDGTVSPHGAAYKLFTLTNNEVRATYSLEGSGRVDTGQTRTVTLQVIPADVNGFRIDNRSAGLKQLTALGPMHADGSASPSTLFGDGNLFTSNVRFENILDFSGNPLPEGSYLVASANDSSVISGCCWVSSTGGQILNGDVSPSGGFKLFRIQDGGINIIYGNQNIISVPGQVRTAMIQLAQGTTGGAMGSNRAVGLVPVTSAGLTSGTATVSLSAYFADGADYRTTVTVNDFKDALGNPVPDGTLIGATATSDQLISGCCWVSSAGGAIIGDRTATNSSFFKLFPVTNGQVVFEYSSQGVVVSSGERTAYIVIGSASSAGAIISNRALATVPVRLLSPASAVVISDPPNVSALAPVVRSMITIRDIKSSDGVLLPDGSKVALSARSDVAISGCCWVSSAGGTISSAGTKPDDGVVATNNGSFQIFTIAGGEVKAVWDGAGISAGQNNSVTSSIVVLSADRNGNVLFNRTIGVGTVRLHGVTGTNASGPTSVPRTGGTGSVTFANITDNAGNVVPDGTPVAVTVMSDVAISGCCYVSSAGGTITNGNPSPNGGWRWLTVQNGAVTVQYSSAGASSGNPARIQITAASLDGRPLSNRTLIGGVWAINLQ